MYISVWVLILGGLIIFWKFKYIENKITQKERFSPVRISISPKWSELFKDYKLADVTDEKKLWEKLWNKHAQTCGNNYCVLKDGVTFTLLESDLVYSNNWYTFHTNVNFECKIEELSNGVFMPFGFYVKWSKDGFDVGIKTPESILDNRDLIKIASIPYAELKLFKYSSVKEEKRNEILKQNGWVREIDYASPRMILLRHKYFDVYCLYI